MPLIKYFLPQSAPGRHAASEKVERSPRHPLRKVILALALLALLAWPFLEPWLLETETVALNSADLPASIGQLRLVYVSDIHEGPFYSENRVKSLVSHINACDADLVLLGGDYATDSTSAVQFFRNLPSIHARYGVYAVVGNHDRTVPETNLNQLRTAMRGAGVTPLINEVEAVRIGLDSIYLVGIDDIDNGWPELESVASQVSVSDYVVFLCHNPNVIPKALETVDKNGRINWFDLGLFGHTHGGQVPLLERLLDLNGVPWRYESGWLKENRIDLLVSRGVGTSVLPVRFLCRPQIHLITIHSGT